jgi:hypothetical protein
MSTHIRKTKAISNKQSDDAPKLLEKQKNNPITKVVDGKKL